jgi:hypothetical protein
LHAAAGAGSTWQGIMKLEFLNHTSVLLQDGDHFLLTDPWFAKLAFDGWVPTPPLVYHPSYLAALSYELAPSGRFGVLISHGHDDHCDDEFLALLDKDTRVFIPRYRSRGLLQRVRHAGLHSIVEIPSDGASVKFGGYEFCAFIIPMNSEDDAVVEIYTADACVIHANDNSIPFPKQSIEAIVQRSKAKPYKLMMSQTNIANCFPYNYPQFSSRADFTWDSPGVC